MKFLLYGIYSVLREEKIDIFYKFKYAKTKMDFESRVIFQKKFIIAIYK